MVAIDYFTKWVEAKPLARIREEEMIEIVMEFIVFHFEIPRIVVTNNGTWFIGDKFEKNVERSKNQKLKILGRISTGLQPSRGH